MTYREQIERILADYAKHEPEALEQAIDIAMIGFDAGVHVGQERDRFGLRRLIKYLDLSPISPALKKEIETVVGEL